MESISRRTALRTARGVSIAAVIAAWNTPAVRAAVLAVGVPSNGGEELFHLEAEFKEAYQRCLAEMKEEQEADEALAAEFPIPPAPKSVLPPELQAEFGDICVGEHDRMLKSAPDHPYCVWYRETEAKNADAWDAYYDAREAQEDERKRRGIGSGWRTRYQTVEHLAKKILATPAVTLPGIMVKVRLGEWFADGDEEGMAEMHKSVIADLEAMTGGQADA